MKSNFSPSININRDSGKELHYIPTNNSRAVYHQIASNFNSGLHSFNIIGSYGTGKSAFLLALTKHLTGERAFFSPINGQFNGCKDFRFINVVGEAGSFIEGLASVLKVEPNEKTILNKIKRLQNKLRKENTCLVLIVDEFGKFLEYAASNDPNRELYFIQRLAEYANDPDRNLLFITTLHQNFDAYAIGLQETQRKEWEKVKGRLKELTFNEPVEQLLNLAAAYIGNTSGYRKVKHSSSLLKTIKETGAFKLLNEVTEGFVKKLYPFDLLSAMALTIALQRYGQNERSLFNFLKTEEHLGINNFTPSKNTPYYNLACVYDYLIYNFYSTLTSKFNPDYFKWILVRNSLERVETEFTEQIDEAQQVIKVIGLLNILGSDAAKINPKLIEDYASNCLGILEVRSILSKLEESKIILFQTFKNRYKLFEGTDIDIELIQSEARQEIGPITNVVEELAGFFTLEYIPVKAVTYKYGTPRIFQFQLSESPILKFKTTNPEVDGLVNLLFTEDEAILKVKKEPILFGIFRKSQSIREKLLDIKAIERALTLAGDDQVAKRELKELKSTLVVDLNDLLHHQLFDSEGSVKWFYNGKEVSLPNQRAFNKQLSIIIEAIYPGTPKFRNELMNKTNVSSSIHYAKKRYIDALIESWNKVDLGFADKGMPPEKTIYFTLLKDTGMHREINPFTAGFSAPSDPSFERLWKVSLDFLEKAKQGKRPLSELVRILSEKPFKLKEGFIEFWLITFLFMRREDFALFKNGSYVPRITKEVAELFMREAKNYEIKTFNIEGVKLDLFHKYRELTKQQHEATISESSFQATARPFLIFYKGLPTYSQQTSNLSHDAIAFRNVIADAKELEKMFFEDLPASFGLNMDRLAKSKTELDQFVDRIQTSIAELRSAYDYLIDRVEGRLLDQLGYDKVAFKSYQSKIQNRYRSVREHLLFPRQKSLLSRIQSQLPDRQAWLNSIVHAILGKQLDRITDKEEVVLYDRLKASFRELDDLTELSLESFDEASEEVLKLEISSFEEQPIKRNIILAKRQVKSAKSLEKKLRMILDESKDEQVNQAALIRILKEMLRNGKG